MARPGLTRLGAKQWMPVLLLFSCVVFSAQFKVSRPLFAPSPMRQGTQREHEGARWRILGGADYGTIGPGMHGRRIRVLPSCSRRARAPGLELKMAREDKLASFLDDLLCQRAVQTQLYYFAEFRDGFKRQWLERFLGHEGVMNYHGFGGLQVKAEDYIREMLFSPPVEHEVKMSWGNRLAGGSKDNPYLQQQPRYNSYTETIHPQKICKGLIEIREQLKTEWLTDLPVMKEEDSMFVMAIRKLEQELEDKLLQNQDGEQGAGRSVTLNRRKGQKDSADKSEEKAEIANAARSWNWQIYKDLVDSAADEDVPAGLEGLERTQAALEAKGGMVQFDDHEDGGAQSSLVRDDIMLIGIRGDQTSSPLRAKNYDVVKKAATYIAVKNLMTKWERSSDSQGKAKWLALQWHDKYKESFEQDSGRHLSDRFLTEIAAAPTVAVTTEKAGSLQMVIPVDLALEIVDERASIVETFLDWLKTSTVEDLHISLQRELLLRSEDAALVGGTASAPPGAADAAGDAAADNQVPAEMKEDLDTIWKPKKNQAPGDQPGGSA